MGIHEFSPTRQTRFVNNNSLNHSGVDFTDISSFPVSGVIYYENTDHPADSVYLYVDGNLSSRDGQPIMTDKDGKFEISVPIGKHYITAKRDGHTFVNGGRYPEDPGNVGTRVTFDRPIKNLTFYNNTLVPVVGRVVGGEIESKKPLAMGQSVNNIGQAEITLTAGNNYRLNVVRNQDGTTYSIDPNPNNLSVASPTKDVNSTAWRQGGNTDEVCNIVIKTDPKTGEFAALLPPLQYRIKSVKIPSNTEIVFDNLRDIDARDVNRTYTDSVTTAKGEKKTFEYVASMVLTHYAMPTFSVTDKDAEAGAFGNKTFKYVQPGTTIKQDVPIYQASPTGGLPTYNFHYPLFEQLVTYKFDLKAYESCFNYDSDKTNPTRMDVPLKNVIVTINNGLSAEQKVYVEDGTVDGQAVKAGDLVELESNQLKLDSVGEATYVWKAGLPNIIAPYTRDLTISFRHNDRDYIWAGHNGQDCLTGIILGTLPSGSNFVTEGPDNVMMILRDPPGSNSYAYWEEGTVSTQYTDYGGTFITKNDVIIEGKFGTSLSTIVGTPGFGKLNEMTVYSTLELGLKTEYSYTSSTRLESTTTTNKRISTSDLPDFVGDQGDVFVGTATNIIFGDARAVDITKGQNGNFDITRNDVVVTDMRLGTEFMFTQFYIENTLIPNLKKLRNNLLIPVSEAQYATYANSTDKPIFITKLSPEDKKFGTNNNDVEAWGALAVLNPSALEGQSYKMIMPTGQKNGQDMIFHYNEQIRLWEKQLEANEKAKTTAIVDDPGKYLKQSYSFDAGTNIESSVATSNDTLYTDINIFEIRAVLGLGAGFEIDKMGMSLKLSTETGGGGRYEKAKGSSTTETIGFVLSESGTDDALMVSAYTAPDGFATIFSAQGGQTSCPYEDAVKTKYYRPGTEISKATMRIEIPEITCKNPVITDIPAGKKGIFRLKLANLSEIEKDGWYDLKVIDKTNTNSAVLSLPTGPIGNGRSIMIEGGKTVDIDLTLAQGNTDVLDYENIGIVLVSQCQEDIADTCYVTAHFVPTSSDVTLRIEQTVMNTSTGSILPIIMRDYDANYKNLKALRIQYKGANDVNWRLAQEYVINAADKTNDNLMLPSGGIVNFQFDMSSSGIFPDQTYLFRALAASTYGNGEVTNTSQPITVIKDMSKPKPLGEPQPADGVLSVGDEISILFNEDIKASEMTQEKNFIVTGALNECPVDHAVALKMDGSELTAATEADIPLAGKSFAAGMWVNIQGAGTLFSHGNAQTKLIVGTDNTGCLTLKVGAETYKSTAVIPQNRWVYLAMNYDRTLAGQIHFNASVAFDAETRSLFKEQVVPDYQGRGILRVGLGIKGAISELALWDEARDIPSAIAARIMTKAPSTPHLIGYWKFDEGNGTSAADRSRNRHMTLAKDNWYLNNSNKAVKLDGASYVSLNISECPTLENDDYAVEMWFKGTKQTGEATLFDTGDKFVRMGFDAQGILQLTSKGTTTNVGSKNYLDNRWHHLALNVLRNGNATVYIDGAEALQIPASKVAALKGDAMHIGASRYLNETEYAWNRYFKGTVDEVRYWHASQSGAVLRNNRLTRLSGKDAGLVAYYPFETQELDAFNQVISTGYLGDQSNNKAGLAQQGGNPTFTDEAPALKPVQNPTNLSYSYVASNNKIVLKLEETPAALEGTTVNFTVRDVHDANNNLSDAVRWSAYVKRNALAWSENEVEMSLKTEQGGNFTAEFINGSGSQQTWTLSNLPAWLTVDNSYGTVEPLASKKLRFNVSTSVPIGRYEETIYLRDNNGIYMPLALKLTVSGIAPDWKVDIARFESSSNLLARLIIDGKPSEDPSDKVGAFVDGECVGVASPMYNHRYDNYFVMMDIYGGTSTSNSNVTFKAYDASTGQIYPVVTPSITVPYTADQFFGKPEAPVILTAENLIEQIQKLNNGWNWISFYVKASDMSVQSVLEGVQTSAVLVKNKTSFALFEDDIWNGKLNLFTNMDMYKLNMNADAELSVIGEKINPTTVPFTINKGWNWIGNTSNANVSVTDAYAGLSPQDGDLVKGQSGFATYDGYEWIGTLKTIVLGRGYMFKSVSDGTRTFTYPTISVSAPRRMAVQERTPRRMEVFTPVSETKYPSNMTMVAQLTEDGSAVVDTEVGVFAGEECRTVETSDAKGILYLTIPGEGTGTPLHFRINHNGQVVTLNCGLIYTDDAMHGSLQNPYLLNLVTAGINGLYGNEGVNIYYVRMTSTLNVDANQVPKRIMIQDIGGRTLYSRTEGLALNNAINLSSFHQGIYIVEVEMPDGRKEVQKILR